MARTLLASLVAFLVCSGIAQATPIAIVNASFEAPITAGTNPLITGWTQTGTGGSGVWNINASGAPFWTVPAPQGNQIAFLSMAPLSSSTPATISQVLTDSEQANTFYTLTGSVGDPIGFAGAVYTVQLLQGSTPLATLSTTPSAAAGTFNTFSLGFNSTVSGGLLQIRLMSNQAQTGFDNIALQAVPTPEPASMFLLGSGLLGIAAGARKRRRNKSVIQ